MITAVNSVSFRNNYNQISFEGKKKENKSSGFHVPMSVKAIPLAAYIAMSPLAVNSTNLNINVEEAVSKAEMSASSRTRHENKLVATAKFDNGVLVDDFVYGSYDLLPVPAEIRLISNDGDDSNAEVLNFYFVDDDYYVTSVVNGKKIEGLQESGKCLNVDTLEIRDVEFNGNITKEYYAKGWGFDFKTQAMITNDTPMSEYPHEEGPYKVQSVQITKEFYDWLKQVMGDEAVYINTYKKEKNIIESWQELLK